MIKFSTKIKAHLDLIALSLGGLYLIFLTFVPISWQGIPCLFLMFTGLPCPGCGMTRAFQQILRWNWVDAFNYNLLAIPVFLGFLAFFLITVLCYITKVDLLPKFKEISKKKAPFIIVIGFALMAVSWILNLL